MKKWQRERLRRQRREICEHNHWRKRFYQRHPSYRELVNAGLKALTVPDTLSITRGWDSPADFKALLLMPPPGKQYRQSMAMDIGSIGSYQIVSPSPDDISPARYLYVGGKQLGLITESGDGWAEFVPPDEET